MENKRFNQNTLPGFTAGLNLYDMKSGYAISILSINNEPSIIPARRCCSDCGWQCDEDDYIFIRCPTGCTPDC